MESPAIDQISLVWSHVDLLKTTGLEKISKLFPILVTPFRLLLRYFQIYVVNRTNVIVFAIKARRWLDYLIKYRYIERFENKISITNHRISMIKFRLSIIEIPLSNSNERLSNFDYRLKNFDGRLLNFDCQLSNFYYWCLVTELTTAEFLFSCRIFIIDYGISVNKFWWLVSEFQLSISIIDCANFDYGLSIDYRLSNFYICLSKFW